MILHFLEQFSFLANFLFQAQAVTGCAHAGNLICVHNYVLFL